MRYWLDTEFIEDGETIDLISIGIVAEDGRELYCVSTEFEYKKASQWVKANVLAPMGIHEPLEDINPSLPSTSATTKETMRASHSIPGIAKLVLEFCDADKYGKPEFWAYYADYDWVVFCQLFGTMMDLPKGFPMYCRDIKQECDRLGNPKLPEQGAGEHNALEDARWNRRAFEFLQQQELKQAIELLEANGYTVSPNKPWYVSFGVWGGSLAVLFTALWVVDSYAETLPIVPQWLQLGRSWLHGAAFDFGKLIPFAALSSAGFGLYGRVRIGNLTR